MNIMLLGATGFIGTNLSIEFSKNKINRVIAVGKQKEHFKTLEEKKLSNLSLLQLNLRKDTDFDSLIEGQDIIFHLFSTTTPTTSNLNIAEELDDNIIFSVKLFDACIRQKVKKVVFLSSGGTVYGKETECPLKEDTPTNPISSYGMQKISIEKLLYLYNSMYGLDYRIIRLANPYGPYQRPNGILGAVTTFTYKALKGEEIQVYGDGSVIRDFIFIDDAVKGMMKIVNGDSNYRIFNLGCGYGTSINQVLEIIERVLCTDLQITYLKARKVDVPVNYLNIDRYESVYGPLNPIPLEEGIRRTAEHMRSYYHI